MSPETPAYIEELAVQDIKDHLPNRIKRLKLINQDALVADILLGKAPAELVALMKEEKRDFLLPAIASSEEFAMNWLASREKGWLDDYSNVIEELLEGSLLQPKNERPDTFTRIKLLVDRARAGVTALFLKELLGKEAIQENVKLETEIYLLIAKLEEQDKELGLADAPWSGINLENQPWLLAVLLYICRDKKLSDVLTVFWNFDEACMKEENGFQSELEEVRPYIVSYFRQALFMGLTDAGEEDYTKYFSFEANIQSPWLVGVIEEVLSHHTMKEIKSRLAQHASESHQSARKQMHHQKIQSIEKEYDL